MKANPELTVNVEFAGLPDRAPGRARAIKAMGWNPSLPRKLVLIFYSRMVEICPPVLNKKGYVPLSRVPKNSPSQ